MRKGSVKNNRVSGEVQRVLMDIIRRDVKDPRISLMVSLTEVYVAPDLKTCKAYVSVLGGAEELANTLKGLQSAEGYIRRELAHKLNMRQTPVITFVADTSIAYGVDMTHRLEKLVEGLPERDENGYVIDPENEAGKTEAATSEGEEAGETEDATDTEEAGNISGQEA